MSQRPLLVIPEAGKEALAKTEPAAVPPKKVHPLVQRIVAMRLRRQMFGPTMRPAKKERLLMWTSFDALNHGRL